MNSASIRVAQIENGKVKQVILAPSVEWCTQTLGGFWLADEHNAADLGKQYDEVSNTFHVSMDDIRKTRNELLDKTDRYTTIDYPHPTEEAKQAWLDYRQALRDLPSNTTDPSNPVWPTPPE